MEKYFITGTGTGIGKSFITASLCRQFIASGKNVTALKPIISGYSADDMGSDTALLLNACGLEVTNENIEKISPWRFAAPLSPDMAAAREGREIALKDIVDFCNKQTHSDMLLIEGVGGVCVPLNSEHTVIDWIKALPEFKIILVGGSYLGSISHTLTACNALTTSGLKIHTLIVNESEGSEVPLADTVGSLKNFLPDYVSIEVVKRNQTGGIIL